MEKLDTNPPPDMEELNWSILQANIVNFVVYYRNNEFAASFLNTEANTVLDIKKSLLEWSGIDIAAQKLIFKGKTLANDETLASVGLIPTPNNNVYEYKLLLIGSTPLNIQKIQNRNVTFTNKKPVHVIPYNNNRIHDLSTLTVYSYTFLSISTLTELNEMERAQSILKQLRDNPGIRSIMERRQWTVHQLIELSPLERGILGYNRNKGEIIALRLRTDDMSGFRLINSIIKVLLHELAHMVWTDHDDNFHSLNRQLNKEFTEFDWTRHVGHRLDPSLAIRPVFANSNQEDEDEDANSIDQGGYQGGTYILEDAPSNHNATMTPRERAAQAALERIEKQNKDQEKRNKK